jgi:hypothetical protein
MEQIDFKGDRAFRVLGRRLTDADLDQMAPIMLRELQVIPAL